MTAQIRKIVVPTDFSDASDSALSYAASMARDSGASLYLLHVVRDQAGYHGARERLALLADRFAAGVPRVATEVRDGDPAESIAEAVLHYGADLVVMATHARTGLSHLLSGSVAETLIRVAACPVLVLRGTVPVPVEQFETETVPAVQA